MEIIPLTDLEMILDFEGPKLAADFQNFVLYLWNAESESPEEYDSSWLVLDLSRQQVPFINFFEGNLSPAKLAEYAELGFGRLSPDCQELRIDPAFRFEPDLDRSPCPAITAGFRPHSFQAGAVCNFNSSSLGRFATALRCS